MKTRILLFLAVSAVVTLSFTFASVSTSKNEKVETTSQTPPNEPVGGFISEDKL